MRKRYAKAENIFLTLLCMGVCFGCASDQQMENTIHEQEMIQDALSEEEQSTENETTTENRVQESTEQEEEPEASSHEEQLLSNKEQFYQYAQEQGIDAQTAADYLQILMEDDVFQNGVMELTGLQIGDMDGNGQLDMIVVVQNVQEKYLYGTGALWFYMNEDEPYCFLDEDCPYFGWYSTFCADLDNDDFMEITFCAQGTGCGGVGDHYKAVFKYKDHAVSQMRLPGDYEEDSDSGLEVVVFQETEADSYSAYCPWLQERIDFRAENVEGWELPGIAQAVGGNARGFYSLCPVEYEGRKVLQASEYLYGEGGVAHGVGIAQFLITWKEDGTPQVLKWWIEEFQ